MQVCILKVVAITIIVVSVVPRCLDLKPASLPSGLSEPYPVEVAPSLLDQRLICTELRQDSWGSGQTPSPISETESKLPSPSSVYDQDFYSPLLFHLNNSPLNAFKPSANPEFLVCVSHSVVSESLWTPWTVALQVPLSMEFSRQEYWSGLPFPSPGDLPYPGTELGSPSLEADSLPSDPFFLLPKHEIVLLIIYVPFSDVPFSVLVSGSKLYWGFSALATH